jgi:membrane fusion protein, multidrug efflux system
MDKECEHPVSQDVAPVSVPMEPAVPLVAASSAEPGQAGSAAPQQELERVPRSRRPGPLLLVLIVLLGLSAITATYMVRSATRPSTSDAYVEGRVVRISPRVSGQVVALNVDDNTPVKAGDVLLEIDPADYEARLDQARAGVAAGETGVQQAEASVLRADAAVGEAAAAVAAAEADSRRRASDARRYTAMGTDGVSEQQLETAEAAADVAQRQREAAEKKQAEADAELHVSRVSVGSARSQLAAAQAALHFAELQLQYTKVVAPESGVITKRNVESGSFVSAAQPLMAIVPADCWVIANFKEVDLEHMRVGQRAEIGVDAYPELHLRGVVQSIQAGTGSRFQLLPPENATGNWVKVVQRVPVKIVLDPDQRGVELLVLGMSVEASVDTSAPAGDRKAQ